MAILRVFLQLTLYIQYFASVEFLVADDPIAAPTRSPTASPSLNPTKSPSEPTISPTTSPSSTPTSTPTESPSLTENNPADSPTSTPTVTPTAFPIETPTQTPTQAPTHLPTNLPNNVPTATPSASPTHTPVDANSTRDLLFLLSIDRSDNASMYFESECNHTLDISSIQIKCNGKLIIDGSMVIESNNPCNEISLTSISLSNHDRHFTLHYQQANETNQTKIYQLMITIDFGGDIGIHQQTIALSLDLFHPTQAISTVELSNKPHSASSDNTINVDFAITNSLLRMAQLAGDSHLIIQYRCTSEKHCDGHHAGVDSQFCEDHHFASCPRQSVSRESQRRLTNRKILAKRARNHHIDRPLVDNVEIDLNSLNISVLSVPIVFLKEWFEPGIHQASTVQLIGENSGFIISEDIEFNTLGYPTFSIRKLFKDGDIRVSHKESLKFLLADMENIFANEDNSNSTFDPEIRAECKWNRKVRFSDSCNSIMTCQRTSNEEMSFECEFVVRPHTFEIGSENKFQFFVVNENGVTNVNGKTVTFRASNKRFLRHEDFGYLVILGVIFTMIFAGGMYYCFCKRRDPHRYANFESEHEETLHDQDNEYGDPDTRDDTLEVLHGPVD